MYGGSFSYGRAGVRRSERPIVRWKHGAVRPSGVVGDGKVGVSIGHKYHVGYGPGQWTSLKGMLRGCEAVRQRRG